MAFIWNGSFFKVIIVVNVTWWQDNKSLFFVFFFISSLFCVFPCNKRAVKNLLIYWGSDWLCLAISTFWAISSPYFLILRTLNQQTSLKSMQILKVSNFQKHFFLKLHCPKILPYEARAEFCQIFCSFFGQWSFKKNAFEIYWPLSKIPFLKSYKNIFLVNRGI